MNKVIIASMLLVVCIVGSAFAIPTKIVRLPTRVITRQPLPTSNQTKLRSFFKTNPSMEAAVEYAPGLIFVSTKLRGIADSSQPGGYAEALVQGNFMHFGGPSTWRTGRLKAKVAYNIDSTPWREHRVTTPVSEFPTLCSVYLSIIDVKTSLPLFLSSAPEGRDLQQKKYAYLDRTGGNKYLEVITYLPPGGVLPAGDYAPVVGAVARSAAGEYAHLEGIEIKSITIEEELIPGM